jgi:hypothetical protein
MRLLANHQCGTVESLGRDRPDGEPGGLWLDLNPSISIRLERRIEL